MRSIEPGVVATTVATVFDKLTFVWIPGSRFARPGMTTRIEQMQNKNPGIAAGVQARHRCRGLHFFDH
jgi:hypothetical protein